jgi:hypothetical protein
MTTDVIAADADHDADRRKLARAFERLGVLCRDEAIAALQEQVIDLAQELVEMKVVVEQLSSRNSQQEQ